MSKASYSKCIWNGFFILNLLIVSIIVSSNPAHAAIEAGKRFFSLEKQKGVNIIRPSGGTASAGGDFMPLKKYQKSQGFPEVKVLRLTPPVQTKIPAGRDFREASLLLHDDTPLGNIPVPRADGDFVWPIPRAYKQYISSPFGYRTHPVTKRYSLHKGVDIAADIGTPVVATHTGIVEEVGRGGTMGRFIKIRHDAESYSVYGHLSDTHVREGEHVMAGAVIGNVGSSGRTTGAHLHYALQIAGQTVDPMPYFQPTRQAKKLDVLAAND